MKSIRKLKYRRFYEDVQSKHTSPFGILVYAKKCKRKIFSAIYTVVSVIYQSGASTIGISIDNVLYYT